MTNDFKPAKAGGNQPRLSKEEYAEKKRAEKEKVYQMIDDASREIVSDPEKFKSCGGAYGNVVCKHLLYYS